MLKEDLSRMEGAYGAETIGKLKQLNVFVSGLRGIGTETVKNLVLAGPKAVTIHDDGITTIADLGANFYLQKSHIGKPRGASILPFFQDLNPNVQITLHTGEIKEQDLDPFSVAVFCDITTPQASLIKYNEYCRNHKNAAGKSSPIAFIYATIPGATACVFTDFGPSHTVHDQDGEPAKVLIVDNILNGKQNGDVTIDGDRHLLSDGDMVRLEEVKGMSDNAKQGVSLTFGQQDVITDINQTHVIKCTKDPKRFTIGNTSKLGEYKGGGIVTEIKQHKTISYKSFAHNLKNPTVMGNYIDFTKFGRAESLHLAMLAVQAFQAKNSKLPALHSAEDAKAVVAIAKDIMAEHGKKNETDPNSHFVIEVDESIITKVCLYHSTELTALAALFGGVVAQEIVKFTGKYTPIDQLFHFDAFELLQDTVPADATPIGCRYDHQISVFGKAWQEKAMSQTVFVVGCGALGCEYLKAIAMTGIGTKAKVYVTDDDQIELSNLNRQFLFRRKHVKKAKSSSAASVVKEMNEDLKSSLVDLELRVEQKSEDRFNDSFWQSLDLVINALDNNIARTYTDGKCVLYSKPLFESGTLGTKANNAICLPHKTPSYSEGVVAGEGQGIAKCTLRNFPSLALHCIEWAREMFDEWFVSGPDLFNSYIQDKAGFLKQAAAAGLEELGTLKEAKKWMEINKNRNLEQCVKLMFDKFVKYYHHGIRDLTHAFPEHAVNIEKGTGANLGHFWHGSKRFPRVAAFDSQNPAHIDFLFDGAYILSEVLKIPHPTRSQVEEIVKKLKMPEWKPSGVKIELDEDKKKEGEDEKEEEKTLGDEDIEELNKLRAELNKMDVSKCAPFAPADFEKDDDENHHIDVITQATNLRAFNYYIKESTAAHCRLTAGRILPALATTTACITGFVQLEVYKFIKGAVLDDYRAATINLAMNVFCCENLPDPIKTVTGLDQATYMQVVAIPEGFTVWDTVDIVGPGFTLQQFFDAFTKQHHGARIDMMACGQAVLYNEAMNTNTSKESLNKRLIDLYTTSIGPVYPTDRNYVIFDSVTVEDESGETGVVPRVRYTFK